MDELIFKKDSGGLPDEKQMLHNSSNDQNVEKALTGIMKKFDSNEPSSELSETLHLIANGVSGEADSQILLNVVYKLCMRARDVGDTAAARDLLTFLLKSAEWGPYAGCGEDPCAEGPDPDQIREAARFEAEQILAEAQAEAERIRREAQDSAKALADRVYEAQKENFVPRAVREFIEKYREEDVAEYRKSDEDRKNLLQDLEQAHADLCSRVKTLQADMNDALNSAQSRLLNGLTQWRESFYKKEVMDLAMCCVNIHRTVNKLDSEAAKAEAAAEDGEAARKHAEQLRRIWRNLDRFADQLKRAVPGVGLDVYLPAEGDRFDPAQHTLGEGDEDDYTLEDREIAGCRLPGVRMLQPGGSAGNFESLIRAEVELK